MNFTVKIYINKICDIRWFAKLALGFKFGFHLLLNNGTENESIEQEQVYSLKKVLSKLSNYDQYLVSK